MYRRFRAVSGHMYSGGDIGEGQARQVMRVTGCVSLDLQSKARSSSPR
ncbi:MAG: hypothetical protein ACYSTQ_08690 [Planctomycetota bacterium]|jgi:hypothetical protein